MKVNGLMDRKMEEVNLKINNLNITMKDSGNKEKKKDMDISILKIIVFLKAHFKIIKDQDLEHKNLLVVIHTKVNMKEESSMVKESMYGLQELVLMDNLLKE